MANDKSKLKTLGYRSNISIPPVSVAVLGIINERSANVWRASHAVSSSAESIYMENKLNCPYRQ